MRGEARRGEGRWRGKLGGRDGRRGWVDGGGEIEETVINIWPSSPCWWTCIGKDLLLDAGDFSFHMQVCVIFTKAKLQQPSQEISTDTFQLFYI